MSWIHALGRVSSMLALCGVAGCFREVSPGHYVLGMPDSSSQPEQTAAAAPEGEAAPAAGPAAAAPAPAPAATAPGASAPPDPNKPCMRTVVVDGRWGRESAQVFCTPADEAKTVAPDPALQGDVALAKGAKVDLSVFGIMIGEPLPLQHCDSNGNTASASCIEDGNLMTAALTSSWPKLPGGEELFVHVQSDKCPNWLTFCTVAVAVKGGSVYAALARVSGAKQQDEMEGRLQQKYRGAVDKSQSAQCTTDLGVVAQRAAVRVWSLQGLRVVYNPLGAGCTVGIAMAGSGLVSVETPTFRASIAEEKRARDAAQPKM